MNTLLATAATTAACSIAVHAIGQCDLSLAPVQFLDAGQEFFDHAFVDIDLDGVVEMIATTGETDRNEIQIYEIDGTAFTLVFTTQGGGLLHVHDLDGDGNPDVAAEAYVPKFPADSTSVMRAILSGFESPIVKEPVTENGLFRYGSTFADIDNDGLADWVQFWDASAAPGDLQLQISYGSKGGFHPVVISPVPTGVIPGPVFGVTGGQFLDSEAQGVVLAYQTTNDPAPLAGVYCYLNARSDIAFEPVEDGQFGLHRAAAGITQTRVAADIFGNETSEIVSGQILSGGNRTLNVSKLERTQTGTVRQVILMSTNLGQIDFGPRLIGVHDFNNDGFRDLAIEQGPTNERKTGLALSNGANDFSITLIYDEATYSAEWIDFDLDGDLDLTWPSESGIAIRINMCIDGPPLLDDGACCLPQGGCVVTSVADCFAIGGSWAGPNTTCETVECPDRCIGDLNFDGAIDAIDLITLLAQWGNCF